MSWFRRKKKPESEVDPIAEMEADLRQMNDLCRATAERASQFPCHQPVQAKAARVMAHRDQGLEAYLLACEAMGRQPDEVLVNGGLDLSKEA